MKQCSSRKRPRSGILAIALLLPAACAPTEIEDARRALLESWGEDFLIPTYERFAEQSGTLDEAATKLCARPSARQLGVAQEAWLKARGTWKRTEVFSFGPYNEFPWRLGTAIDFWPARPKSVERAIKAGSFSDTTTLGAADQGLPAVEWLLFRDEALGLLSDESERCEYLTTVTDELTRDALAMRRAWDPDHENYLSELTLAGRGSREFDTLQMALGEVVNRMAFLVENIREAKLGKPLGTEGSAQPDKAESQFSGASLEDILNNLLGIEHLYFGNKERAALGLRDYLRRHGANFDTPMRERLKAARSAIGALRIPLTEAVIAERKAVERLTHKLADLQRLIQIELVSALSLTLTFNDNDGD